MKENDNQFLTDGKVDSWIKIFEKISPQKGDVLVFYGGERLLEFYSAGWHIIQLLATDQNKNHLFHNTHHIVPSNLATRDIRQNLQTALEHQLTSENFPPRISEEFQARLHISYCDNRDSTTLVERLTALPKDSAVSIMCAELYRFPHIAALKNTDINSWFGIEYAVISREAEYREHLFELIRQTIEIAQAQNLFVTLFCEEYMPRQMSFPLDLSEHPNLIVMGISDSENIYNALADFENWIALAKNGEFEFVMEQIAQSVTTEINKALLSSKILFACQRFAKAWEILEPHLQDIRRGDPKLLISVAQTALAAGNKNEAKELINLAVDMGVNTLSDINSIYVHAQKLEMQDIANSFFNRMSNEYPAHPITLEKRFIKHLRDRDFSNALNIAILMDDDYAENLCQVLMSQNLTIDTLIPIAQVANKVDEAYLNIAYEAKHRGLNNRAKELASKVMTDADVVSSSIRLRIELLADKVRNARSMSNEDLDELKIIMRYTALSPGDINVRFEIEELLESTFGETSSLIYLMTIAQNLLFELASSTFNHSEYESTNVDDPQSSINETSQQLEISDFLQEFLQSLPKMGIIVGRGELPRHLSDKVSRGLLVELIDIFSVGSAALADEDDINSLNQLLHLISLICKEVGDPYADLQVASLYIGQLAHAGFDQMARDIAETALQLLANNRDKTDFLRIGEGWRCCSEAFHRTNNFLSALRTLIFCILCFKEATPNLTLLQGVLSLAVRIYRDLGFGNFALEILSIQKRLGAPKELTNEWQQRLDVTELSVKVVQLQRDTLATEGLELLTKSFLLLEQETEPQPLLALIVTLTRQLKLVEKELPSVFEEVFNAHINKLKNERLRSYLTSLTNISPSIEDLQTAVNAISNAEGYDDLSYQVKRLIPLAESAVRSATLEKNADLFLLASALLSQPILSLMFQSSTPRLGESTQSFLQWQRQQLSNNAFADAELLLDIINIQGNISPRIRKSFDDLTNMSLVSIVDVIDSDEAILLLCQDDTQKLCFMMVTSAGSTELLQIDDSVWSHMFYNEWKQKYPQGYGSWQPAPDPFTPESPSEEEIIGTIAHLGIATPLKFKRITLVPDSKLFGFPFTLTRNSLGYLGEHANVTITPSVSWLHSSRTASRTHTGTKKAWLGSPDTEDWTIHLLRDRINESLTKHYFTFIENDFPLNMRQSDIAVIGAHGSLEILDQFDTISDSVRTHSPKEFASYLRDCGCVILFVCHSGRSDTQIGNLETIGMVSELLRVNVKSVIAPPWPLHVDVAATWLPNFLDSFLRGSKVGEACYAASHSVKNRFSNPCAWLALQVYGDSNYCINAV